MRYLDVCSGYSAFTQGATGLDFECAGYAEIDAFPAALLGHHYGAGRPRYMPDPDAAGIDAKERKTRIGLRKSMASLADHHFGNRVPNFGDFTQIREDDVGPVDGLVGGTPCQSFSIAGKRLGLDDPRGNLTLEFLALAKRLRVEWLAWENVPGFLSHDEGRTMGTFLRLLGELGFGWAYRVLDAQYIRVDGLARAVPQRRNRLIVVGCLGDAARAAAILFERESLRGYPAPRREAGQGFAGTASFGLSPDCFDRDGEGAGGTAAERSGLGVDRELAYALRAKRPGGVAHAFGGGNTSGPISVATTTTTTTTTTSQRLDFDSETFIAEVAGTLPAGGNATGGDRQPGMGQETADTMLVAHALRAEGFDASEDGTGRGTPIVPVAFVQNSQDEVRLFGGDGQTVGALAAEPGAKQQCYVADPAAYRITPNDGAYDSDDVTGALTTGRDNSAITLLQGWAVRRLTPRECERLMGLRDDFTLIPYRGKPAADGA